jgi:hypothetical protein
MRQTTLQQSYKELCKDIKNICDSYYTKHHGSEYYPGQGGSHQKLHVKINRKRKQIMIGSGDFEVLSSFALDIPGTHKIVTRGFSNIYIGVDFLSARLACYC